MTYPREAHELAKRYCEALGRRYHAETDEDADAAIADADDIAGELGELIGDAAADELLTSV